MVKKYWQEGLFIIMRKLKIKYIVMLLLLIIVASPVSASGFVDTDNDGVPDKDERLVYFTDVNNWDTDGDGYSDWIELNNGYSPYTKKMVKLEDDDYDNDGLSDRMELNFGTNPTIPDTDGDGYSDGDEIDNGYSPLSADKILLSKRIEINTEEQTLSYFLDGVKLNEFLISSGKASTPTEKGTFNIINKSIKAWSPYGLWMPYWMGLKDGSFGLHQLPVWPNGYREGENHLGVPVSHGCIRLGIKPSEILYNWAEIGTPVVIY